MKNNPQYWHSRIPLRVQVLGILFSICVLAMLALLWWHWQLAFLPFYLCLSFAALILCVKWIMAVSSPSILSYDEHQGFILLETAGQVPVRITHLWASPFSLTLRFTHHQKRQLVFWRGTMSSQAWRQLQICVLHYQLQHQLTELKGA